MSNPNENPGVRPVKRIQLPEGNTKLRIFLLAGFAAVAVFCFVYGMSQLLRMEPGWQQVEVTSAVPNCGGEFMLQYNFGQGEQSARQEQREVSRLYSQAAEDAYRIFDGYQGYEGVSNVWSVNQQVNKEITLEPALYEAFALLQQYGRREHYLAPIYEQYDALFYSRQDFEAEAYDPAKNPAQKDFAAQVAAFAADESMVQLELLGQNRVCLRVSEDYLAFAQQYGITSFVDLYWMKNAFIADYLAQRLTQQGYTRGYLASFDGFTRNLGTDGGSFKQNLFRRDGKDVFMAGELAYDAPATLVYLRSYPISYQDRAYGYVYADGSTVSAHASVKDGISRTAMDDLLCYSKNSSCAEVLMEMLPAFLAEEFSEAQLQPLTQKGIYAMWNRGSTLCYNQETAKITLIQSEKLEHVS